MRRDIKGEIAAAVSGAGSTPSEQLVRILSDEAVKELAAERFDQLRRVQNRRQRPVDSNQLPLPGFEALHAFYLVDGIETKLEDLTPDECLKIAAKLEGEAAEWNVPRQRDEGAAKLAEAKQLKRWAAQMEREKRA